MTSLGVLGQLDPAASAALQRFVGLIERWNKAIQVVATRDVEELYQRHVLDSLAVLPHLASATTLVDVGAGGGFPGAVLAIARPSLQVTSLEPIHKKHAFLATVKRELGLANYRPLAERDEQHRAAPGFQPYDAAISRATFALGDWLERGVLLVRPGGAVIGMEGRETIELPPATTRIPYQLADRSRALLVRIVDEAPPA